MSESNILSPLQTQLDQELFPSPDTQLPLDLHLQRFMVPTKEGKPAFLIAEGELIALNLSGLTLKEDQLSFLKNYNKLKALNLSGNAMEDWRFPENLTALEYLDLGDNKALTKLHFPAALPELKRLDLGGSGLEELSFAAPCPKLKILMAQGNKIKKLQLPKGFNRLNFLGSTMQPSAGWPIATTSTTPISASSTLGSAYPGRSCRGGLSFWVFIFFSFFRGGTSALPASD